jgi:hypothetical protein
MLMLKFSFLGLLGCLEGRLSRFKAHPIGRLDGRSGRFMLTAIEPEVPVADGGVHEGAMMGLGRAWMGVRPKMAAAYAHALLGNGTCELKGSDDPNL